jgi:hypothetical protein
MIERNFLHCLKKHESLEHNHVCDTGIDLTGLVQDWR